MALLLALSCRGAPARAQTAPTVATRPILVEGISADPHADDVLGIARVRFQGLIASELSSVGYRTVATSVRDARQSALVLSGTILEEVCDDISHAQCRVAVRWELQEQNGLVVYRVVTRAVDEQSTLESRRRGVVLGALHSLLVRRRFAMRLVDPSASATPAADAALGFRRCQRAPLPLPESSRAVAAGLVLVESGSRLSRGTLISGDGMVLAPSSGVAANAPLRVRFSGGQTLAARLVAQADGAGVVLLHVGSSQTASCLALAESALAPGEAVFGVSSDLGEDDAVSITRSVVKDERTTPQGRLFQVDARIARSDGAPLLDQHGNLTAIVVHASPGSTESLAIADALDALDVAPAPITDPRLLGSPQDEPVPLGYVRDTDDPAFVLAQRYTYGTGTTARRLRTAGAVTAAVGAASVAYTWLRFGGGNDVSPAEHDELVLWNDVGWAVLGLGVAGLGASFVWPQRHQVVDAQSARGAVVIGVSARGITVGGELE